MPTVHSDKKYKDIMSPADIVALWCETFGEPSPSDCSVLELASELITNFKGLVDDLFHNFIRKERFVHDTTPPEPIRHLWYVAFEEDGPQGLTVFDAANLLSKHFYDLASCVLEAYLVRKFMDLEAKSPAELYQIWLEEFSKEETELTERHLMRKLRAHFSAPSRDPWIKACEQQFAELNQLPSKELHQVWKSLFKEEAPPVSDQVIKSKLAVRLGNQSYNAKQKSLN